jgi:hypothetical protein
VAESPEPPTPSVERLSKLECAKRLIDAALAAHLDRKDSLSAIVLAGSAEDVLHGMLAKVTKTPEIQARMILAYGNARMRAYHALVERMKAGQKIEGDVAFPQPTRAELAAAASQMREVFTWLRHADRDEPQEITVDLENEAAHVLVRALINLFGVTREDHPLRNEIKLRNAGPNFV